MSRPAQSPYLITAPSEHVRVYEMAVLYRLKAMTPRKVYPWIRISADDRTGEVTLAAGMRVEP